MKILYLDCFGGISGDMTLGALIDAGISLAAIKEQLTLLGLGGCSLQAYQAKTHGFKGTRFLVEFAQDRHPHRTWGDISRLVTESKLPPRAKKLAASIFEKLAKAEGKVHGISPEKVHFHEVGAVDSIIDIVGTAVAIHEAGIEKVYCSPLPSGYGQIKSNHGLLPIPAPATAELLRGIPIRPVQVEGELVTPTGAAIVAALTENFGPAPAMRIDQIGYGLGSKDYGIPNFLRVLIGEELSGGWLCR
ncbi:MAG: LarC family nickel insertion protein [Bacillota bacterium]